MEDKSAVTDLLRIVEELQKAGTQTIDAKNLITLLRQLSSDINNHSTVTTAERQHQLEVWKAQIASQTAHGVEMFKALIEAGQTTLKSATVINGGAAAALLALMADALKAGPGSATGPLLSPLGWAWFCFMLGLGLSGIATAARYISQALYSHSNRQLELSEKTKYYRQGNWGRNVAMLLGAMSFAAFFIGSTKVLILMLAYR